MFAKALARRHMALTDSLISKSKATTASTATTTTTSSSSSATTPNSRRLSTLRNFFLVWLGSAWVAAYYCGPHQEQTDWNEPDPWMRDVLFWLIPLSTQIVVIRIQMERLLKIYQRWQEDQEEERLASMKADSNDPLVSTLAVDKSGDIVGMNTDMNEQFHEHDDRDRHGSYHYGRAILREVLFRTRRNVQERVCSSLLHLVLPHALAWSCLRFSIDFVHRYDIGEIFPEEQQQQLQQHWYDWIVAATMQPSIFLSSLLSSPSVSSLTSSDSWGNFLRWWVDVTQDYGCSMMLLVVYWNWRALPAPTRSHELIPNSTLVSLVSALCITALVITVKESHDTLPSYKTRPTSTVAALVVLYFGVSAAFHYLLFRNEALRRTELVDLPSLKVPTPRRKRTQRNEPSRTSVVVKTRITSRRRRRRHRRPRRRGHRGGVPTIHEGKQSRDVFNNDHDSDEDSNGDTDETDSDEDEYEYSIVNVTVMVSKKRRKGLNGLKDAWLTYNEEIVPKALFQNA